MYYVAIVSIEHTISHACNTFIICCVCRFDNSLLAVMLHITFSTVIGIDWYIIMLCQLKCIAVIIMYTFYNYITIYMPYQACHVQYDSCSDD